MFSNNPSYLGVHCDMTESAEVSKLVEATVRHFGGLDILVSNAGVFPASSNIEDLSDDSWSSSMSVNLDSHFYLLRESIPYLRFAWNAAVVFVGSKILARTWCLGIFSCQMDCNNLLEWQPWNWLHWVFGSTPSILTRFLILEFGPMTFFKPELRSTI